MGISIVILNLAVLVSGVMLLVRAIPEMRTPAIRWLCLLIFSFCVISFCTLMVYMQDDIEMKIYFSRFRFLTFGFLAPAWLLFLSATFKKWNLLQTRLGPFLLLAPGMVTSVLTIFPSGRDFVITDFSSVSAMGLTVVSYVAGKWFPVHYGWSSFLVVASWVFGGLFLKQVSGVRRRQLAILILGSIFGACMDFFVVGSNSNFRWLMLTSATYLFTEGAIFYSVFRHRLLDIAPVAKEKIFRDFPDPVIVLDEDGEMRDCNKALAAVFGIGKERLGQSIEFLIPELTLKAGEAWLRDRDGQLRYFIVKVESIADESDFNVGKLVVFREITMQKRTEEQLAKSLEFKARLLALVSHDLTDCLESQYEFSLGISDAGRALSVPAQLSILNNSMFASKGLLANLLAWSNDQGTQFQVQRRQFELNTLIRTAIESQQLKADPKEIRIVFESQQPTLLMKTDTMMVESIVRNILSNAVRASAPGQTIRVHLKPEADRAFIRISDEGIGMEESQLANIMRTAEVYFSDFGFRGERYGLGLSIVRKFTDLLGGRFQMNSRVGVGTEVSLEIPIDIESH